MVIIFSLFVGILLGLFGGGAGILTVPVLHYALHMPMEEAITTSLLILFVTSLVSTGHYASKQLIQWRQGVSLAIFGAIGAYLGAQVAHIVPTHALILLLVAVMIASATAILCKRTQLERCEQTTIKPKLYWHIVTGLGIGLITGMVGAGGGFLVVPALVLLFRQAILQAIGTSVFVIVCNTGFGLLSHAGYHQLNWSLLGIICSCAIVGTFIGHRLAMKLDTQLLHKGFAAFIISLAFLLAFTEIPIIIKQAWYLAHPYLWLGLFIISVIGLFYFLTRICLSTLWRMPFLTK